VIRISQPFTVRDARDINGFMKDSDGICSAPEDRKKEPAWPIFSNNMANFFRFPRTNNDKTVLFTKEHMNEQDV
jgi:hypothetical protein